MLISLGLLPIGIGLWEICTQCRLNYLGVRCTGVVVDLQRRYSNGSGPTFAPVVEFVDAQGRQQRFTGRLSSAPAMHAVGDEVAVVYLPDRPDDARVNSVHPVLTMLVVAFVVGAVFIAIGLSERH